MKDIIEYWRTIYINEIRTHYHVSTLGRIKNSKTGFILKPTITDRYLYITLKIKGKHYKKLIHRIVAEAFIPNPNKYPIVNHLDGNKQNPEYTNLEWTTQSGNVKHALEMGLMKKGEDVSIYSNDEIIVVCELLEKGLSRKKVSKMTGIPESTIGHIKQGHTWKHISCNYDFPYIKEIDEYLAHLICSMLQDNMNVYDIRRKTEISIQKINKLRRGKIFPDIRKIYNIKNKDTKALDESAIRNVMSLLDLEYDPVNISEMTGINIDSIYKLKRKYFNDRDKLEKRFEKEHKKIEEIKRICELLEKKMSFADIINITKSSYDTIQNVKYRRYHTAISHNYNF